MLVSRWADKEREREREIVWANPGSGIPNFFPQFPWVDPMPAILPSSHQDWGVESVLISMQKGVLFIKIRVCFVNALHGESIFSI